MQYLKFPVRSYNKMLAIRTAMGRGSFSLSTFFSL